MLTSSNGTKEKVQTIAVRTRHMIVLRRPVRNTITTPVSLGENGKDAMSDRSLDDTFCSLDDFASPYLSKPNQR